MGYWFASIRGSRTKQGSHLTRSWNGAPRLIGGKLSDGLNSFQCPDYITSALRISQGKRVKISLAHVVSYVDHAEGELGEYLPD